MKYIDYYNVLGVNRTATKEEISKAYKRLARKYHPDLNKEPGAEDRFKEINEAHEVLKDDETRKRYDMLGANWKHGSNFDPPPGWNVNVGSDFGASGFSSFFESVFGNGGRRQSSGGFNFSDLFGGMGDLGNFQSADSGMGNRDIESAITIQLEDAFHGQKRSIVLDGPQGKKRYDVKIPQGIREGEKIRLAGQGVSTGRGSAGDLYLTVQFAPHPKFKRDGDNLVVEIEVNAWDAALGGKISVPTINGDVTMTLPRGISSGQRLRLRGKGMPDRSGKQRDLFAEIRIVVPKTLSPEQEKLFEELRKLAR